MGITWYLKYNSGCIFSHYRKKPNLIKLSWNFTRWKSAGGDRWENILKLWQIYMLLWWQSLSSWLTHIIAIVSNYPDKRTTHMYIGHMYNQMHFWKNKSYIQIIPKCSSWPREISIINIKANMYQHQYISFYWNWASLSFERIQRKCDIKQSRVLSFLCVGFYNSRWLPMNL